MELTLIAIGTFIPMLVVLVVVHELGHFATARAFGVKALEFGVGFPPRAFGFYTGRTSVLVDQLTVFVNLPGLANLRPGQVVKVSSAEDREGNLVARTIEVPAPGLPWARRRRREEPADGEYLKHEGKVRAVAGDSFILADMLYSLNWMPLGGFVRLAGESNPAVPRSLAGKGTGARFLVLAAGPFMNAVLPILIYAILFMIPQNVALGQVRVTEVAADSPAAAAGVKVGDIVVRAGGRKIENQADLIRTINLQLGSDMEWAIDRNGEQRVVRVIPRDHPPPGQGPTGVSIQLVNDRVERRSDPPWVAMPRAFAETGQMLVALKREVSSWITRDRAPQFIGPVGLVQVTGEFTQQGGLRGWLLLTILLSINLAIFNILPIPMLDGGRLVFVVLEWLRRGKRVPPQKEGLVHLIGLVVLVVLILVITANDINRLIQGGSPLGG
jgi:regulator of sigma E protease